jgi:hypothetical protein
MLWQVVLIFGALMALLQLGLGWLIDLFSHRSSGLRLSYLRTVDSWRVHLFPAGLIALIFFIAWAIEYWTSATLISGVMVGAPLVSLLWLGAQGWCRVGSNPLYQIAGRCRHYAEELVPSYRMELTILSTAGFAGAVVGYFVEPRAVTEGLDWIGAPAYFVPALVMGAIILGGVLGLNAIITVMIISGALPNPEAFGVQSEILGIAYLTGWGLAVGSSPVSMSTLIVGNLLGQSGARVGLHWNGLFTLLAGLMAAMIFGFAVILFPV